MHRMTLVGLMAVLSLVLGSVVSARHDGPHGGPDDEVWTINKNGEVKMALDVVIGGVAVRKGKYAVDHRVDGDTHTLVLTSLDRKSGESRMILAIPMRLIPSRDPVKKSALFVNRQPDRSWRVDIVQIAGESGDHMPGSAQQMGGGL